jgi:hypothetical protein
MQQGAKARNANIYSNYNIILDEKKVLSTQSSYLCTKGVTTMITPGER